VAAGVLLKGRIQGVKGSRSQVNLKNKGFMVLRGQGFKKGFRDFLLEPLNPRILEPY
jgi:hypothetical protein